MKFKPDEARAFANTTYQVNVKLASVKAVEFPALMDEDGLHMHDVGSEPDQYELPDTNHNVRHIKEAKHA